jgi:hypothetical protein
MLAPDHISILSRRLPGCRTIIAIPYPCWTPCSRRGKPKYLGKVKHSNFREVGCGTVLTLASGCGADYLASDVDGLLGANPDRARQRYRLYLASRWTACIRNDAERG